MASRRPDLLAHAYATLGLAPGCSHRQAARQYRRLVRRWHPDQYANDPQGQAEAAQRMREINRAFAVLRQARQAPRVRDAVQAKSVASAGAAPRPRDRYFGRRLTDSERDAIVDAIGSPGIAGWLMRYVFWAGSIGAAYLLMAQPGQRSKNALNYLGGLLIACGAAGHLARSIWRRKD